MQPPPEQVLLVNNALTGPLAAAGPPVIKATAVKEYADAEDIVGHTAQAFARETNVGRVADNGTKFILENTSGPATSRAEIPSKNDVTGDFSGATAFSMKGRIITAGASGTVLFLSIGATAEPRNLAANDDVFIRIVRIGVADPLIEMFYRDLGGTSIKQAATANYPAAETATLIIERTSGCIVYTVSTPTLGTVCANIAVSSVRNGSSPMFGNVSRAEVISEADECEVNEIGGFPAS